MGNYPEQESTLSEGELMYIGNIHLPAVERLKVGNIKRPNEAIAGLGVRGYSMAEFTAELPTVSITGYLLQKYGSTRTKEQYAEDIKALAQRTRAYNYVDGVKGHNGWIACSSVDVDYESGELWPMSIEGQWFDASQYKEDYQSNPVTRDNDWSITGTYSETTAENADDVKVFDGTTEIFSTEHIFSGNCIITNGLYKVELSQNIITLLYWSGSAYTKIDDFSCGSFSVVSLITVTSDLIELSTDNSIKITVERGRVPMIDSPVDLTCMALTPADQSTSGDNYLTLGTDMYVCSNRNFSIASNMIDAGKLWIFYAESNVQTTAHNVLVKSNLKRNIVER